VEGRFCRAYLSETPLRAANLAPVIGERGPIGIRRSAAIQHNKCRQSGYCSYLIRPGVSERPEIIEVFRGPDIDAPRIKPCITIEVQLTGSRLEIGITPIDARGNIPKMIIIICSINKLRVLGNIAVNTGSVCP